MKEIVRRGVVHTIHHERGHVVLVAYVPKAGESDGHVITHSVSCTEAEAELFREGQQVVLTLELDVS